MHKCQIMHMVQVVPHCMVNTRYCLLSYPWRVLIFFVFLKRKSKLGHIDIGEENL